MGIQSETSPEKSFDSRPFYQANFPSKSNGLSVRTAYELPDEQEERLSFTPDSCEGEWICGTDLLQMGSSRKRPRLLPQKVKMFVFIEKKSRTTVDCTDGCCHQMSKYATQTEELNKMKGFYNLKVYENMMTAIPKHHSKIHPKKRLLRRFIKNQNELWFY